eukprot:gene2805-4213_t
MSCEIIYTGNLLRYLEPQKNIQDEFQHSIQETLDLNNWEGIVEEDQVLSKMNAIRKCHKCFCVQTILFLDENATCEHLREAVSKVHEGLKIKCICECFLNISTKNKKWKEIWQEFEKLREEGQVSKIGISNFQFEELKELLQFCKIKPFGVQISFRKNESLDEKLVELCESNEIRMIAGPEKDVSITKELQTTFQKKFESFQNCEWFVRYSTAIVCQTLIRNRGYILKIKN